VLRGAGFCLAFLMRRPAALGSIVITLFASSGAFAQALPRASHASGPVRFSAPAYAYPPPARQTALYWRETPRALAPAFLAPERRLFALPQPSRRLSAPLPAAARAVSPSPRGRQILSHQAKGRLSATATNYCVRLCDGYAFPIGDAARNSGGAQEMACRSACPGAPTALFTAPAGARDFNDMSRGGLRYTSLPMAFRYRKERIAACSCNAVGATQSVSALYSDPTLRRGDLAMSARGMLHFDGGVRLPHQRAQFSDALARLTNKREIALVRGMEAASLRDGMSSGATSAVKARVIAEIRQSEQRASAEAARQAPGTGGFVELTGTAGRATTPPTARRPAGLVAMN